MTDEKIFLVKPRDNDSFTDNLINLSNEKEVLSWKELTKEVKEKFIRDYYKFHDEKHGMTVIK